MKPFSKSALRLPKDISKQKNGEDSIRKNTCLKQYASVVFVCMLNMLPNMLR